MMARSALETVRNRVRARSYGVFAANDNAAPRGETFRLCVGWEQCRAFCVQEKPILAPAVDLIADWPVPPGFRYVFPALVLDLATVALTHLPIDFLRGSR